MTDRIAEICQVIENELRTSKGVGSLSSPITATSKMGDPKEWDSLAFVSVFLQLSAHFNIDVEDEDAVNFTSVDNIDKFLTELGK